MPIYTAYNNAMATTALTAAVTTGTALKTMLQIAPPATRGLTVLEWGISFDGAVAGQVELIQTDVAATTGTAHVASGVQPADPNETASLVQLGAALTGFTFTVEGSTTATRLLDRQQLPAGSSYSKVFADALNPAPQWARVQPSKFLRVRVLFGTAVNAVTWIRWLE